MAHDALRTRDPVAQDEADVEERHRRKDAGHDVIEDGRVAMHAAIRAGCRLQTAAQGRDGERCNGEHRDELEAAGFTFLADDRHPGRRDQVERQGSHDRGTEVGLDEREAGA